MKNNAIISLPGRISHFEINREILLRMSGVDVMSIKEINVALISKIPEDAQQQIFVYLTQNFCNENPFAPKSADEIYADLERSRICHERGEYEDFDDVLDSISKRYGL